MNYKHTQGEWGVDYGGGTLVYAVDCGTTICEINHYRRNGGKGDEQPEDEAEANAKLIASAPKLLENEIKNLDLLEWFLSKSREFNMWSDKIQVLQNRISETKLVITNATTV